MVVALIDDLDGLDIQQIVSLNCYTPNSVDMDLASLYPDLPRWAFYDAVGNSVIPAQGKHMRDLYFDVLGWEANYSLSDRQAIIAPEQTEKFSQLYQRWISENGERAYALHLDTHKKKMWAIEKWTEVVSHLWRRWNAWPIVLGKDSESSRKLEQSFRFVRKLPSKPMALHLSAVKLLEVFIGVDSIFAHIADSYSKPMVVLYGPTDLALWGPMNPQAWVVRPDGEAEMSNISIDKVICTVDGAFQQIYPFPRALRGGIII
jgi:ADP-heptose:LPS heptosyltransferase